MIRSSLAVLLLFAIGEAYAKPTPRPTATPAATKTPTPTTTPTKTPTAQPTPTPAPPGAVSVVITEPAPDAVINSDRVSVRGTFSGPPGTGIVVNDTIAFSRAGKFAFNDLPLTAGMNTITVIATAVDGRSATTSITVTASGNRPPLRLTADVTSGFAPLSVTFGYERTSAFAVTKLAFDFDGDGRDDVTIRKSPPASVQNTYTVPGLYNARLTLTDAAGTTLQAYLWISVEGETERDDLFTQLWNAMNDALVKQDVSTALSYLNSSAQQRYGSIFTELLPDMPEIVASYSQPQRVAVTGDILEYAVNRTIDGEDAIFLVYALLDGDGVWRLDSM